MSDPRKLAFAMVSDDEGNRARYLENAWFHAAIDHLAEHVIPALVLGLAVQADEKQAEQDRAMALLMNSPRLTAWGDHQ